MIQIEDLMDEMCEEFPEISQNSIKAILKKGLFGIRDTLKKNEELIIQGKDRKEIKFYIPLTPENQAELTAKNISKRKYNEKYRKKHI